MLISNPGVPKESLEYPRKFSLYANTYFCFAMANKQLTAVSVTEPDKKKLVHVARSVNSKCFGEDTYLHPSDSRGWQQSRLSNKYLGHNFVS